MERQPTPHERNYEPRYCRECGFELEENERYICDVCEENEECSTDENLFL